MSIKCFVGLKSENIPSQQKAIINLIKQNSFIGSIHSLIKFYCLLTTIKNIYLKIDRVDYHIFINLFVNHVKIVFWNIDNLF